MRPTFATNAREIIIDSKPSRTIEIAIILIICMYCTNCELMQVCESWDKPTALNPQAHVQALVITRLVVHRLCMDTVNRGA